MWMISGTGATDQWQRLGALLIQRRTALNPRFHNRGTFCDATGLKYRLVYDIEEARRTNFGSSTLAAIEAAYQLAPGTIRRVLDGGPLEVVPAAAPASPPPRLPRATPEMQAAMAGHLAHIRELVEAARLNYPGEELRGAQIFPRDESNASWWWDRVAANRAFAPEDIPAAVAAQLAWDDEEARLGQEGPGYAAAR